MAANDRGYGHGRFAGVFAVVKRQSECGSKTAGMHVSQPMNIGVCYGQLFCFVYNSFSSCFVVDSLNTVAQYLAQSNIDHSLLFHSMSSC